jgi:signal peptidase I
MLGPVERYSSDAGRRRAGRFAGNALKVLAIALVLFLVVSRFLVSTYRIESVSMQPALAPADRVIVSSRAYGPRVPFSVKRLPGLGAPKRGELVVVQPPFLQEASLASRIFEPIVSFFTLQKATLHRDLYNTRVNGSMVKRVIGIPGDTVRMAGYLLYIKVQGASDFVPEQQLIALPYSVQTDPKTPGVTATTPLSGSAPEIVLKANEYYVLGDNRPDSSDSRSWGPLAADRILGKVIFRYWPPHAFGKL